MKKALLTLFATIFYCTFSFGQVIPEDQIIPVCSNQSISTGAPDNSGVYNLTLPCNEGQPLSPFMDFYYLRILSGTTFAFKVTPVGQDDYDFGAWKNPNWNNIGATPNTNKRGSQNDPTLTGIYHLGLSLTATDLCETGGSEGNPEPGMVKYFDVQPGDEILIAIDRWSQTSNGYTLEFGGDAILDCTVLGNSYGKCDTDDNNTEQFGVADFSGDLEQDYPNHNFKFYYNQSDAEANNNNQIVFPLNVNYNGGNATEIFVRVETGNGSFVDILKLFLYVNKLPEMLTDTVQLPLECGDENGQAVFDLTQSEPLFVNLPADYIFKYYTTEAAANAGGNDNIPNPTAYQSAEGSVYARIETGELDGNEDGCFSVGTIQLEVSDFDVAEQTLNFDGICDDDGDGFVTVDLTQDVTGIVPDPTQYQISYHESEMEAQNGSNPIADPANYSIPAPATVTVYVRIQSLTDPCFSISKMIYNTIDKPALNPLQDYTACDDQQEGSQIFDLTQFEGQLVADPAAYSFGYFLSEADAENNSNPIQDPANFQVTVNTPVEVFIRVESNGCFSIDGVMITIRSNPEVNDLGEQAFCTDQQTGTVTYDLTVHRGEWVDDPAAYSFEYYLSMADLENGTNPIADPVNFEIQVGTTVTVYIKITDLNSGCYSVTELTLFPGSTAELNNGLILSLCDEDFDGIYHYNLNQLANLLAADPNGLIFSYYLTPADAEADQNPIPADQWTDFQFTGMPVQIWAVAVTGDGCRSYPAAVTFTEGEKLILDSQIIGPLGYCESEITDLSQFESEIFNGTAVFSYYQQQEDAQQAVNPIANTSDYSPQGNETVYVRVEKDGFCPEIAEIRFKLLPTPDISVNETVVELCPGDVFEAEAFSSDPNPQFEWYLNGNQIGTGAQLDISQNGDYTVVVTGAEGCTNEAAVSVVSPAAPQIESLEFGPDYIIVSAAAGGNGGLLEYSLDQIFWQSSAEFSNLIPGETYSVYVRQDGCMTDSYKFTLLLITNFISPNGDGINDTWEIRGVDSSENSTLRIFDRYGKLFVDARFDDSFVWNGKYMGANVQSGDYWFILEIPGDEMVAARRFVGHISVRNQ